MVKKSSNDINDLHNEPLAIIGMNCQFPGMESDIESADALYNLLAQGQNPIKEVPKDRWNIDEYYDADRKKTDKIVSRLGGFLNDVHLFDADFFKIAPAEAKQIDPQHRLFLEVSIRALNHANITHESLNGSKTGVYCGISSHDYNHLNYKENIQFNGYTMIGAANSAAPGRLSYFLNLKGPGMAVDTACSSSLAALYLAATDLRTQQCHMAIVGGVQLNLCPENFIGLSKANMLSATGRCSSFDRSADGFVRSEGCGVVVIKRLSDAIKDKNTIHGIIKSIVMNQDGDEASLVAPGINAQIDLHRAALDKAKLTPADIDYLETHGTGTVIGDSVEFKAIEHIHQGQHSTKNPLILGALKSTIGHTIASSGIASLIKVICAFKKESIPPNLHYSTETSSITPETIPALLPTQATQFTKQKNKKRYAQVSNFGFTGTNVTLIVEEPPAAVISTTEDSKAHCFVLSAASADSLTQMLKNYVTYLQESTENLSDISATLIHCRDHYKFRCAIIAKDKQTLIKKITTQDYEIIKVNPQNETIIVSNNPEHISAQYLAGANVRLDNSNFNKVDLPLYHFNRKPYWHEPRKNNHWLAGLSQLSRTEQETLIKEKINAHIALLINQETVDEYQDFDSLGLNPASMEALDHYLVELCLPHYKLPSVLSSPHLNSIKLARHICNLMIPTSVARQPAINVLNIEPIAIIGMSCRFPKAESSAAFLSLLEQGESGMSDIPLERWNNELYYDPDVNALGKLYIKQLGLIDNIKNFDADFFNISPREAKFMSPQLRVFMESSYHALEDANLALDSIKDSNTGVFVGVGTNEYPRVLSNNGLDLEDLSIYFATGNVLNALAGRIAYAFDFHGPIQVIDTACSSSMTAIHNACLSLQAGDCNMALAGGVNTLLTPDSNVTLSKARMLSPESRCKTFSDDADGYARSEGCGVLILKRLSTAIKDRDTILAVIQGSSVNSDGKSGGFTVPNGTAQEEVIRSALAKAKLSPADIDCIEAHGTGTPLADPIEVNALTRIFSDSHSKEKPLYISSVKTNIGHCESASGVAGVIKAVLSLKAQKFFKHLNFKKLNPNIELNNAVIPLNTIPWTKEHGLRTIGVSSFGFSGANAHLIIQEAPAGKKTVTQDQESLLVISASSKPALELLLSSYQKFLATTEERFADICFTAATCRNHYLFCVAIKASSTQEAAELIAQNNYSIHAIKKVQEVTRSVQTLDELQTAYLDGIAIQWSDFYKTYDQFNKVKLPLYEFDRKEHWIESKNKLNDLPIPSNWCFQMQWQNQSCDKTNKKIQGTRWLLLGNQTLAADFVAQGLEILVAEDAVPVSGIIFAETLNSISDIDAIKKLLQLVKAQAKKAFSPQLIVLTSHATSGPLIGFCKTLSLELPQFNTTLIQHDSLQITKVMDEINYNHGSCYEPIISYRDGKRFVQRLKRASLPDKKQQLTGNGRYLITGGCGGLGLVTAQALLSAGAKELILTSRTVDKPELQAALKKIQSNFPASIIRAISLDVTDKESLRQLLIELNADKLLKGIIHAAGSAIKKPLIEHQDADVDYLFAAKVKGAWYLHELSQECDLDFFIVYSSIAALFGSNKEAIYSAANSALDALITERQRLGLVGTAIQWGPWGEVGMASKRSRDQGLKNALITNEQGQAFIKVLMNSPLNHACIIAPDFLKFMLDFVPKPLPVFYKTLADDLNTVKPVETGLSSWLTHYLNINEENRLQTCKEMLTQICRDILELSSEELDHDDGFFEIGFDSLMIAEMASELKKKLEPSVKVLVNIGFDHPSINKLAQFIAAELDTHLIKKQQLQSTKPAEDSIAIIGMSCALPNAPDIKSFETLLEQGLSGIKNIPVERWDNSKYYDPDMDAPGKSYVTKMGLLNDLKQFDAHFFGISPREAKLMEPQQRLFLENCYKALENANYPPESLRGSLTGVFAGVGPNEYYALLEKSGFSNEELSAYSITGNVLNLIPGRAAYFFDFKGPSLSIDTACSSSMVALHYACQSLKNHETDYALAGGVNILLMPESNVTLSKAKALAPDGQCKTFDEKADGYARSEGCGVLMLKRVSDALRDKDTILAVIKASAVNNDGQSAGLTVPNGKSQEDVMKKALSQTNLASEDISYIETHGTGTPLGDPIEVHAINNVYGTQHRKNNPLYLGTVKTNIGHLESASGIASIIKTVLGLQNKRIYKHLNFARLNPNIKLNEARIALENLDWHSNAKLKSAGVNAFGFSGTNAHVILQEFPSQELRKASMLQSYLLVLSAKSSTALNALVKTYQEYLKSTPNDFGDICFTAATCRDHYSHRVAVFAKNAAEAALLLDAEPVTLAHDTLTQYLAGESVDWNVYYQTFNHEFNKVLLPNYTFDRMEFWPDKKAEHPGTSTQSHPLLGSMLSMPGDEYLFNNKLDLTRLSYINQHRVFDKVIFPGTAYPECGLAAAQRVLKSNALCIEQVTIERPIYPKQDHEFQVQVKPIHDGRYKLKIFAKHNSSWQSHCDMEFSANPITAPQYVDINQLKSTFTKRVDLSQIYAHFQKRSLFYGEEFQVLQEGYVGAESILTKVTLTKATQVNNYYYHPVLLDGAMQSVVLLSSSTDETATYVPYFLTRMRTMQEPPSSIWVHLTKQNTSTENDLCFDLKCYDNSGLLIAEIEGLKLRKVAENQLISYDQTLQHLYYTQWKPVTDTSSQELPEFFVITNDKTKAKKRLGNLKYHLVTDFNAIENMAQKNLVFLYEQGQFDELFACCKMLFKSPPASFVLVTEHAFGINKECVNPYHTMASAFWNSFSNELDLASNYTIDCDTSSSLVTPLQFLFNGTNKETQCAVRDGVFIPRLKKKQPPLVNNQLFDSKAAYLIVGGTGGLAELLINYLISRGVTEIHLTSRSAMTRPLKAQITHHQVDVSNYQQMEQLIQSIKPLKGVFHLAGVVQDGLLVNLTAEKVRDVLSAKMDGALILHQLTKNIPLDLFVLFSSSASVLGASGQSNYAAANGFLDGLAHLRHHEGLPALSLNWGPFQNIGMTANLTSGIRQHGYLPMDKNDIEILDVLLKSQWAQIAPCPMDWDLYCKHATVPMKLSEFAKQSPAPDHHFLNRLKQVSQEECIIELSQALCTITAKVLALDSSEQISAQDNLFSLGMDSLMAIEIRSRIHDQLHYPKLSLPIEYFINCPTIEKIAINIANELQHIFPNETPVVAAPDKVALCDFQYIFWVLNKLDYGFNIGMQLQLHGAVNKDFVAQAFDLVVKHNSAFWIRFNKEEPTQQLDRQGQFQLVYEDRSLDNEQQVLHQEFQYNLMRVTPLEEQPLIRVYLYTINSSLHELHLLIPHIIVDDVSCELIFSQFKHYYAELVQGKKPVPIPEKESFFNFVQHHNEHYEKDLNKKADFWRDYNRGFEMLSFGHPHHLPDATKQTQCLFHYPIPHQLVEPFIDWHKAQNINVTSGLIAACQIAFYKLSQQSKMPIILIRSGREGSQFKSVVGLFSEYKRVNLTLNKQHQFIDCIQAIEEQIMLTTPYQKCSHLIKDSGLHSSKLSPGQYVSFALNKLFLTRKFKESKLDSLVIHYYLKYLTRFKSFQKSSYIKHKINQLFNLELPLQKPERLRVLISITPSLFTKEIPERRFADLDYSFPNHFSCMERPVSSRTLWVYFSKNQHGEYQFSINGPLTKECKDQISVELNRIIASCVGGTSVEELLK